MNNDLIFYNTTKEEMNFSDVFKQLLTFMEKDPTTLYRLAIGTDSQVHSSGTKFITTVHLHRVGKGAWGCLKRK